MKIPMSKSEVAAMRALHGQRAAIDAQINEIVAEVAAAHKLAPDAIKNCDLDKLTWDVPSVEEPKGKASKPKIVGAP